MQIFIHFYQKKLNLESCTYLGHVKFKGEHTGEFVFLGILRKHNRLLLKSEFQLEKLNNNFRRKGNRLTLTVFKSSCKSFSKCSSCCCVSFLELEVGAPSATSARVSAMQDKKYILCIVTGLEVTVSSD